MTSLMFLPFGANHTSLLAVLFRIMVRVYDKCVGAGQVCCLYCSLRLSVSHKPAALFLTRHMFCFQSDLHYLLAIASHRIKLRLPSL